MDSNEPDEFWQRASAQELARFMHSHRFDNRPDEKARRIRAAELMLERNPSPVDLFQLVEFFPYENIWRWQWWRFSWRQELVVPEVVGRAMTMATGLDLASIQKKVDEKK